MNRTDFLKQFGLGLAGTALFGRVTEVLSNAQMNNGLVKANRLQEGAQIGLVAPAGIVFESSEFERMKSVLESMGFRVRFGAHVRSRSGYFSGSDRERAADLNWMFEDPEIDGIVAVRGGWGSARILEKIDFDLIRNHPKFFCGFSDITALHLSILRHSNLVTFHGPNGSSDWTLFTRKQFYNIATGRFEEPLRNPIKHQNEIRTIREGTATGPLMGGNLTVLNSLLGTSYLPNFRGAILFLEDIGEAVYKVDRMLAQLKLSGILGQINGFVFGRCTDCETLLRESPGLMRVLESYLLPLEIPAFYGSMISHEPNQFTLPVGIPAEIDASAGSIRLLENPLL